MKVFFSRGEVLQLDLIELFSMKQSRFNLSFDIKTQASPQKAPLISPVTGMSDGGWRSFCLPSGFTHFKTFFTPLTLIWLQTRGFSTENCAQKPL